MKYYNRDFIVRTKEATFRKLIWIFEFADKRVLDCTTCYRAVQWTNHTESTPEVSLVTVFAGT